MKKINILHKITSRIDDFHDSHLPLLKFAQWFMVLNQDLRIACKVTDDMRFLAKTIHL